MADFACPQAVEAMTTAATAARAFTTRQIALIGPSSPEFFRRIYRTYDGQGKTRPAGERAPGYTNSSPKPDRRRVQLFGPLLFPPMSRYANLATMERVLKRPRAASTVADLFKAQARRV